MFHSCEVIYHSWHLPSQDNDSRLILNKIFFKCYKINWIGTWDRKTKYLSYDWTGMKTIDYNRNENYFTIN